MKKIISIIIITAAVFIIGCFKEEDEIMQPYKSGAILPEISGVGSSFFDSFNFAGAYIEFTVDFEDASKVESITIEQTYDDVTLEMSTYNNFPATVRVTASEAVANISGVTVNDLVVGDVFTYEIIVKPKSGVTSRSNVLLNASVACKSSLAGTYSVLANGSSTDTYVEPSQNPTVDFVYEVDLIETGVNGVYTITDFSGGLFTHWYDGPYGLSGDQPGTIQDVCNTISYIYTVGPYGSPIAGGGSFDSETGIITISGEATWWGDTWTLVLTPVK